MMFLRRALLLAMLLSPFATCQAGDEATLNSEELWPAAPTANASPAGAAGSVELVDGAAAKKRLLTRPMAGSRARSGEATTPSGARESSWFKTTLSLAGVIALIVLLAWGYKLATGGGSALPFAFRGRHAGAIQIVGRTVLSPKQSLCLVRVGPRLLLLGLGGDGVRTLDVVDQPDIVAQILGETQRQRADSRTAEFSACLDVESKKHEEVAVARDGDASVAAPQPLMDLLRRLGELRVPAKS